MKIVFSYGTIWVLILSSLICLIAPIVLIFRYMKRYEAKITSFFLGMAGYLIFRVFAYQIIFSGLLIFLPSITKIPWQSAFYTALISAFTGGMARYVMLKYVFKNRMTIGNALMYGTGQGGLYAMTYGTSLCITNAITAILNNYLGTVSSLEKLGYKGEALEIAKQGIYQLHEISTIQHLFDGLAPFIILLIEVALSVFVFIYITNTNAKYLFPISFILHFIVLLSYSLEKITIISSPLFALAIILGITIVTFYYANKLRGI